MGPDNDPVLSFVAGKKNDEWDNIATSEPHHPCWLLDLCMTFPHSCAQQCDSPEHTHTRKATLSRRGLDLLKEYTHARIMPSIVQRVLGKNAQLVRPLPSLQHALLCYGTALLVLWLAS